MKKKKVAETIAPKIIEWKQPEESCPDWWMFINGVFCGASVVLIIILWYLLEHCSYDV